MTFLCSRILPRYGITFSCVSFGYWVWQFLRLCLLLMTMTVLRSMIRHFVGCLSLCWNFFYVFLKIRLGLWVFVRITEVKCHFHHIISRVRTIIMIYDFDSDLDYLAEVVLSYFSTVKLFSSSSFLFHSVLFGRKSLNSSHT